MLTVGDVYGAINAIAPFSMAMDFDNVGLLVGNKSQPVSRVLLALDITVPVVEEAAEIGAQLIVSHHPVIFHPLRGVATDTPVYELAQNGISAICAHTNLDLAANYGVNDALAIAVGLNGISMISDDEEQLLRIGKLPEEKTGKEFLLEVKQLLSCGSVQVTSVPETVRMVAVCGGAGGDYAPLAKAAGADIYITGEAKHSEILDAAIGMPMAVCGHHATEFPAMVLLQEYLQNTLPQAEFIMTKHTEEPYITV